MFNPINNNNKNTYPNIHDNPSQISRTLNKSEQGGHWHKLCSNPSKATRFQKLLAKLSQENAKRFSPASSTDTSQNNSPNSSAFSSFRGGKSRISPNHRPKSRKSPTNIQIQGITVTSVQLKNRFVAVKVISSEHSLGNTLHNTNKDIQTAHSYPFLTFELP